MIGKLFVAASTSYFGYLIVSKTEVRHHIVGYWLPCAVFGLVAFLIADVFLKVYDIATESIL